MLCWQSRQPRRHKEPFICPRMFKPCSRHAARCPSSLDNRPESICACLHAWMWVCVYICFSPSSISTTSGGKVTTPSAPGMRPDGLCGRQENITLKCVESARGTTEYSCVCVRVCVLVITSWTKLGFQGYWLASGAAAASWPCSSQRLFVQVPHFQSASQLFSPFFQKHTSSRRL